jgi:hypothetical protein
MTFFPPGVLADVIAMNLSAMPDTFDLHHLAPGTVNPDGSGTDGTETVTSGIPCRFVAGKGIEALVAGRVAQEADAVLYCPLGTTVDVKDTVVYLTDRYQVLDSSAGASFATSLLLTLKLVK